MQFNQSNLSKLLPYLIEQGTAWVAAQRDWYRPLGRPLTASERRALAGHFSAATLESVVISTAPRIQNPSFYKDLSEQGIQIPLDFRGMSGITFNDTVLIATDIVGAYMKQGDKQWMALLFHECVHVCQYRVLGLGPFLTNYVNGWASKGFAYRSIPAEAEAYRLQAKFEAGHPAFSVEAVVADAGAAPAM